jgi:hypothetical protein
MYTASMDGGVIKKRVSRNGRHAVQETQFNGKMLRKAQGAVSPDAPPKTGQGPFLDSTGVWLRGCVAFA